MDQTFKFSIEKCNSCKDKVCQGRPYVDYDVAKYRAGRQHRHSVEQCKTCKYQWDERDLYRYCWDCCHCTGVERNCPQIT